MTLKKIISLATSVFIASSMLKGCNNTDFKNNHNAIKEIVYEVGSTKNTTNEVKTEEFNLGTRKINDNGKEYSYKLEGDNINTRLDLDNLLRYLKILFVAFCTEKDG